MLIRFNLFNNFNTNSFYKKPSLIYRYNYSADIVSFCAERLTEKQKERIEELYTKGMVYGNIAKQIGRSLDTVKRYIENHPNFLNLWQQHDSNFKHGCSKYTSEQEQEIFELCAEGRLTIEQIAEKFGCSISQVYEIFNKMKTLAENVKKYGTNSKIKNRTFSKKEKVAIRELYYKGKTAKELAKLYGCHINTIYNIVNSPRKKGNSKSL